MEIAETFAPTSAHPTFMLGLNIFLAERLSWSIEDVQNTFVQAPLKNHAYMVVDAATVDGTATGAELDAILSHFDVRMVRLL